MYSDHRQAETTGVVIGRRQGREAGYAEGWNAAIAACEGRINDLEATLNAMFVIAYPALVAIHLSGNRKIQSEFVRHYQDAILNNALQHMPHRDPQILNYDQNICRVIDRWMAAAHTPDNSPSP